MFLSFIISFVCFFQGSEPIIGEWKLRSYDAIDKIRLSPAYIHGDEQSRKTLDGQFELMLSEGRYIFKQDTLIYTDIENGKIKFRSAVYKFRNDTLYISEVRRDFEREAFIRYLSSDSLVISPIIEKKAGDSQMIFTKVK